MSIPSPRRPAKRLPGIPSGPGPTPEEAAVNLPAAPGPPSGKKKGGAAHLLLHLHPRQLPAAALAFSRTFGLGGMAVVLVLLLAVTGILLLFVYEPSPAGAYASLQALRHEVRFGRFIRNIHHWSGHLLLIITVLHLLRVFFTGAFHPPRAPNWILGLLLLVLVTGANFTGYLLPWDQLAYWAVTISTGMLEYLPLAGTWLQVLIRRGPETGPATLATFFALHVAILPILTVVFMLFHFWLVRKAGGIILPAEPSSRPALLPAAPHLTRREGTAALVLLATVLMFSALVDAPLQAPANPGLSPNPAKAPWYFTGLQELLIHFHPFTAVFLLPLLAAGALLLLPYLPYTTPPTGRWFHSPRGARLSLLTALLALVATPLAVAAGRYRSVRPALLTWLPEFFSGGLLPLALLLGFLAGLYRYLHRRRGVSLHEAVLLFGVACLTVLLVLTATGIWFRGPGMELVWPWSAASPPP